MKKCVLCDRMLDEDHPETVWGAVCQQCKLPDSVEAPVDWAEQLVQTSAWRHIGFSSSCIGWTMASSGRARCGACEWECSGRMSDVGEIRSAVFSQLALATIGEVFAHVIAIKAKALAISLDLARRGVRADVTIDETGCIVVAEIEVVHIHQAAFTHIVKL